MCIRDSSVCPFWRPKPFTSVVVRPVTPFSESASRTSSSLNGLTMASIFFMSFHASPESRCYRIAPVLAEAARGDANTGRRLAALVLVGLDHAHHFAHGGEVEARRGDLLGREVALHVALDHRVDH